MVYPTKAMICLIKARSMISIAKVILIALMMIRLNLSMMAIMKFKTIHAEAVTEIVSGGALVILS